MYLKGLIYFKDIKKDSGVLYSNETKTLEGLYESEEVKQENQGLYCEARFLDFVQLL